MAFLDWQAALNMEDQNYAIVMHTITVFTVAIQIYVLYLIARVSPKEMSDYRYFLLTFCFWDLFFTLMFGGALVPVGVPDDFGSYLKGMAHWFDPKWQIFLVGFLEKKRVLKIGVSDCKFGFWGVVLLERERKRQLS